MTALLAAPLSVTSLEPHRAEGVLDVAPDDAVFAGHFPGFAVVPGVYLLDAVHRLATAHAEAHGDDRTTMVTLRSARFRGAVLPGDTLTIHCAVSVEGGRRVRAECRTARGVAASFGVDYDSPRRTQEAG